MDIASVRHFIHRDGDRIILGNLSIAHGQAREIGERLILLADAFEAEDAAGEYDGCRLDVESSAADRANDLKWENAA